MWAGRIREILLGVFIWAILLALVLGVVGGAVWWIQATFPRQAPVIFSVLAIVAAALVIAWWRKAPLTTLRQALTPKYWGKINDARRAELADPFLKPAPFRLDPDGGPAAAGLLGRLLPAILFPIIRFVAPNARIWPLPLRLVTRYDDVLAVLRSQDDFQTAYGAEMQDMGEGTNFVLGMNGPAHAAARGMMDQVMGNLANPADGPRVAQRAAEVATALVDQAQGRMDVVADLIRRTAAETCIEYFGLEAPDPDSLADWTMAMSRLIFADPFGAPETRTKGLQASQLFRSVAERSLEVGANRPLPPPANETLVNRLLRAEAAGALTRPETLAFLTGTATGLIPTITVSMTKIIGELLSRPMWWKEARRLAVKIREAGAAGDPASRARLRDILMEAARLSPTLSPGQFRIAAANTVIARGSLRAARVQPGDVVVAATAAALRDGRRFRWPNAFNPDRPVAEKRAAELMYGAGVHKCVGIHIAEAVNLEIAIALFSRDGLAPATDGSGDVKWAGPFPRNMEMTWTPDGPTPGQTLRVFAAPLPPGARVAELSAGLTGLRAAGGRGDLDRTGIVHFATFAVVDLAQDPQRRIWPGRSPKSQYWLIGDLNYDGEPEAGLKRITDEMEDWIPTLALADPGIETTEDIARFLARHTLDIRATPWGSTGLQYQGSIGLPVSDILRQRALAEFVRSVAEVLNVKGSVEARDRVRPAGGPPDALQILDTVRRLIRGDDGILRLAAADPAFVRLRMAGAGFERFLVRPLGPRLKFSDYRSTKGSMSPPLGEIIGIALRDRNRGAVLATIFGLAVASMAALQVGGDPATPPLGVLWALVDSLVWVSTAAVITILGLLAVFTVLVVAHETAEKTDVSLAAPNLVEEVEDFENEPGYAQNPMISITWIKPGLFRRYTHALGMWAIRFLVVTALRPGDLARMNTVHFARWVRPKGTNAILFISNYDGSWLSYLEDFSAIAPQGVNLAWGHSQGFPTPRLLIEDGCRDSDSFKRFAKRSMRPADFWYSAYPDLTLENTRRNALIHDGLLRATNATEAQDWLDLLASVKRPEWEIETDEVQTLVLRGLGSMPVMQCGLVSLPPGADLAGWTLSLAQGVNFGNSDPDPERWHHRLMGSVFGLASGPLPEKPDIALFVAFSASGLVKLGLPGPQTGVGVSNLLAPFYQGMSSRARILRDAGPSAPGNWVWSDGSTTGAPVRRDAVDAVLLAYGMTEADCAAAIDAQVAAFGLVLKKTLTAPARPILAGGFRAEPFGFTDGVSNPVMKGLRGGSGLVADQVEAGEVLLGYPHNRPGNAPTCAIPAHLDPLDILPAVTGETPAASSTAYIRYPAFGRESGAGSDHDFGRNGTFLVVRQLEQDVAGFNDYTQQAAAALALTKGMGAVSPHWVAAKMVGRWKDGSPVVLYPDAEPRRPDVTNDFTYGELDARGFACPLGAHIRRTNPRDTLISDLPNAPNHISSHRILRRGRAYQETDPKGVKREGLVFLAACADLERQFEMVQQSWLGDPSFHGLTGEADPVVDSDGQAQALSLPDGRTVRRLKGIPDFVTVRGGGYFFMPSRSALYYLADRAQRL